MLNSRVPVSGGDLKLTWLDMKHKGNLLQKGF